MNKVAILISLAVMSSTFGGSQNATRPVASAKKYPASPIDVIRSFVDDLYDESTSLTEACATYTDWPDFGPGDSVLIATRRDIRLVSQSTSRSTVEVRFAVIGEMSDDGTSLDIKEREDKLLYKLSQRIGTWRIQVPIFRSYVSLGAAIKSLHAAIDSDSSRIAAGRLTSNYESAWREHIENEKKTLRTLERYQTKPPNK